MQPVTVEQTQRMNDATPHYTTLGKRVMGVQNGSYLNVLVTNVLYWNCLRTVIRKNWNDTEKISMAPAQG